MVILWRWKMARVLIVDDAMFMRMTIKQMLEAHGHSVAGEAGDGIEAVKKFIEYKPDVVLLDITMPEMNGVEALKRIKELDPDARVIICSAMGQQAMVAQAIQYGAKDFIVKPFEEDRLIAAVDKIMSR
jgi:two-component system chemotaxis response regulator CheY